MRIAVVGSREFRNLEAVRQFVYEQTRDTVIISGGAQGVDDAAHQEARRLRMPYEIYRPDWAKHGKQAGAIRNHEIVKTADEVVAFWDGKSRGTKITMDIATQLGKPLTIING